MALGHYGTPSVVAAGAALALLIVHLAVPFGLEDFSAQANDAGLEDDAISASEVADRNDEVDQGGLAATGWILSAAILGLIAGVLLLIVGFLPVGVHLARVVGWLGGLLAAMAGLFGVTSTAHWLGTGFMTLLGVIFQNPHLGVRFWVISPVITFALALVLMGAGFAVMAGVIAKRDGLREQAQTTLNATRLAVFFMVAILVVPWSFQVLSGEDRRGMGLCDPNESCKPTYTFFSAWGMGQDPAAIGVSLDSHPAHWGGINAIAEHTAERDKPLFQGLSLSISVFVTMAWVAFFLGAIRTAGPLISSMFNAPRAARFSTLALAPNLLFILWAGIMFLLAGIYQWRPSWDDNAVFGPGLVSDQSWWFGFAPLAAVPFLVMFAVHQWRPLKEVVAAMRPSEPGSGGAEKPRVVTHTFD